MTDRWIKLYPRTLDNPVVMKDSRYLAVWVYLLLNANFKKCDICFHGQRATLNPGEFSTGRKMIASDLLIPESTVQRILKDFEDNGQIRQRTDRQCRIISIINWDTYQSTEQQNSQKVNNESLRNEQRNGQRNAQRNIQLSKAECQCHSQQNEQPNEQRNTKIRTTNEQRMNTKEEYKNVKNIEKRNIDKEKPEASLSQTKTIDEKPKHKVFVPPTVEEVAAYVKAKGYDFIDPEYFVAFYEANGWVQGKARKPIKNWKACCATWKKNGNNNPYKNEKEKIRLKAQGRGGYVDELR